VSYFSDYLAKRLPTVDQVAAERHAKAEPIAKGKTRLETRTEARPLAKVDEKQFKDDVWARDKHHCRCCGRKVVRGLLTRAPERGEVNHIHGRRGDLRFEVRAALLMCLTCHERFTGRVNAHKLQIVASKTFTTVQGTFTDATFPVTFREAA
jgi:hypothetical protein